MAPIIFRHERTFLMARYHSHVPGRIRAGGKWVLGPGNKINLSLAENLDMGPGLIQTFRQRRVHEFATWLQNTLSTCADPPANP